MGRMVADSNSGFFLFEVGSGECEHYYTLTMKLEVNEVKPRNERRKTGDDKADGLYRMAVGLDTFRLHGVLRLIANVRHLGRLRPGSLQAGRAAEPRYYNFILYNITHLFGWSKGSRMIATDENRWALGSTIVAVASRSIRKLCGTQPRCPSLSMICTLKARKVDDL